MHLLIFSTTLSLLAFQVLGKSNPHQRLSRSLAISSSAEDPTTASQVLSVMAAKTQFYTQFLSTFLEVDNATTIVVEAQISERTQTLQGLLGANDTSLSKSCFDFTSALSNGTTANNTAVIIEAVVSGTFSSNGVQSLTDSGLKAFFQETTITQGRHEGFIADFVHFDIQSGVQPALEPSLAVAFFQDFVSDSCKSQPILANSKIGIATFNPQQLAPGDNSASLTLSDLTNKGTPRNVIFFTNSITKSAPLTPKAGDKTTFTFAGPQMENQVTFAVVSTSDLPADAVAVGVAFTIDGTV